MAIWTDWMLAERVRHVRDWHFGHVFDGSDRSRAIHARLSSSGHSKSHVRPAIKRYLGLPFDSTDLECSTTPWLVTLLTLIKWNVLFHRVV